MIALFLAGCNDAPPPRPENVPVGAAFLRYEGNELKLDETALGPWKELSDEPTDSPYEPLTKALNGRLVKEVGTWIALPGNASWGELRRAVHTVLEAEAGPIWIGALATDRAFGPLDNKSPAQAMLACSNGPLPIVGANERLVLELQSDDTESWVRGNLRFRPTVRVPGSEPVAADFLPKTCWQPTPCAVLGANLVAHCEKGMAIDSYPDRVEVGGEHGCVAPLYKGESSADVFVAAIPDTLGRLGLDAGSEVMVMADDNVELEVVFATLSGLAEAGIVNPQLGLLRMGSSDGAPVCNAPVTSREQVDAARAMWFGQQLRPEPAPGEPQ